MDASLTSQSLVTQKDAEIYTQLRVVQPHVGAHPEVGIEDLTDYLYPPTSLAEHFSVSHHNSLMRHNNRQTTMTGNVSSVRGAPLAIFTSHWYKSIQEQHPLRLEDGQTPNYEHDSEAPPQLREHWFMDSEIWGVGTGAFGRFARYMSSLSRSATSSDQSTEAAEEATPMNGQAGSATSSQQTIEAVEEATPMNSQAGSATSSQQTIEAPEEAATPTTPTRALRVRGPAEVVNAKYIKWFWARNHRFHLESITDYSTDSAVGDVEIWFQEGDEEEAKLAHEALMDPEFSDGLNESVVILYLPDN